MNPLKIALKRLRRAKSACQVYALAGLVSMPFAAIAADDTPREEYTLTLQEDGQLSIISTSDGLTSEPADPASSRIQLDPNNNGLTGVGGDQAILLKLSWLENASLEAPMNIAFTFNSDTSGRKLAISVNPHNSNSLLKFILPDGAVATLQARSSFRVEFMADATYILHATYGVVLTDTDGLRHALSDRIPPYSGGELTTEIGEDGTERFVRKTSEIKVRVYGRLQDTIGIQAGEQFTEMETGESKPLSFPNGAQLTVRYDPDGKGIQWDIESGYFDIGLDEIPSWNAKLISNQKVRMEWDNEIKTVDLFNLSSESVIISLPSRTYASVESGGHLQTTIMSSSMFSTSASGNVSLFSQWNESITSLTEQNLIFKAGTVMADSGGFSRSEQFINLTWDVGSPLLLSEIENPKTMMPDSKEQVSIATNHDVSFEYTAGGQVQFEALRGNYRIKIAALNGIEIVIQEGDNVTMSLDIQKGTFTLHAAESNFSPLSVFSPNGSASPLDPSDAMNFNLDGEGFVLATNSNGESIFFEGAGDNRNRISSPENIIKDGRLNGVLIDADRLPESMVSPFRVN